MTHEDRRVNLANLEGMIAGYEIILAHLLAKAGPEVLAEIRRELPDISAACTQDTVQRVLLQAETARASEA
jgi:hypothetical protein